MIAGIFHQGSGLGNQLFRYVTVRTLAMDKGYRWGMLYHEDGSGKEEGFKGTFFLEQPREAIGGPWSLWNEKKVIENGVDIRGYDPEINFVQDNTLIDGEFQDPRYWEHRLPEINEWLKVDRLAVGDDTCIIGFRGGEYAVYPDLFLPFEYWSTAISHMRAINPDMIFHVVTDDVPLARNFFPYYTITHEIGMDWKKVRFARYSIIANSSFYILPRILAHSEKLNAKTIAPRYWARRSAKNSVWALPQNYYKQFLYV